MNNLLSVKETAKLLNLHQVSIRRLITQDKIKARKIGGRLFVYSESLGLSGEKPIALARQVYGDLLRQGIAKIGVWGVGYIGFSTLVYFAVEGIKGIGYDVDKKRVRKVNHGEVDIPGLDEWLNVPIKHLIAHHLIKATDSAEKLLAAEPLVHFICIPTEKDGEPWFEPLKDVVEKLARYLSQQKPALKPLIIIESTLAPGVSDQVVLKIFHKKKLKKGEDFLFAVAPRRDWFVDQAKTLKTLDRVFGASDEESARQTLSVLSLVCDKLHQAADYKISEMVKSIENAYRHMEITLANQLTLAYPGASMREVLRLVGTKWNIGTFRPSFGTGGYCIPLSSKYVISGADKPERLTLLRETIATDESMPKLVARAILKHGVKSVGILGLSYRGNIKVPHQSPAIGIAQALRKYKVNVKINDPYFTNQEIFHLTGCLTFAFPNDIGKFEALVLIADHAIYQTPSARRMLDKQTKCKVIYDNLGMWQNLTYFNRRGIKYYIPGDDYWLK